MTLPVICLVIAGGMLAVGLLGGGLQFRDLVVPRVGHSVRATCFVLGLAFAGASFRLYVDDKTVKAELPQPITFRIENVLGEGQLSEHVRVYVNGEVLGTVTVSEYHRSAEVCVPVRAAGRYSYQLTGDCVYRGDDGATVKAQGMSEGYLDVQANATYLLTGELAGSQWRARIEKKSS